MSEKAAKSTKMVVHSEQHEAVVGKYKTLHEAVRKLYYSAVWHADRPILEYVRGDNEHGDFEPGGQYVEVGEASLWEAVREAAEFERGRSPEEVPYPGIRLEFPLNKLRLMATTIRKDRGGEISSEQIAAILDIFRQDIEARANDAVREFLEAKLK